EAVDEALVEANAAELLEAKPEDLLKEELEKQVIHPAATVEWLASEEVAQAEELGFLTRAAASGGQDEDGLPDPVHHSGAEPTHPFLRPAGRRLIGEVEVPEKFTDPHPVNRATASGLGPDHLGGDLSTPAYTRKYMD
ncbi:MAG: hypothetical protein KOO60_02430, partial [Gemmatimonadales bacterium]|nr:hypothetical protein [Gemmatimonadales bacterium]